MPEAAPDLLLRPGRPGDAREAARVHRAAWAAMIQGAHPGYPVLDLAAGRWAARWEKALEAAPRPRQGVALLERGGRAEGVAWLGPFRNQGAAFARRAWLRRLYVQPRCQGCGHGSRLLAWAEARARAGGAASLELWVLEVNAGARAFYEARGYRADGATGEYRREGIPLGKLRYRKRLDPPRPTSRR